eukprot:3768603-Rhodomonas_salina.1
MNASVSRRETRGVRGFFKALHETFTGGSNNLIYVSKRFIILPLGDDNHKNEEAIKHLQREHGRHFLVWNLSDPDTRKFETKDLEDQVLDVTNFPDYVPTLQFTFETCNEIRYWLKQDPLNVAVVASPVPSDAIAMLCLPLTWGVGAVRWCTKSQATSTNQSWTL